MAYAIPIGIRLIALGIREVPPTTIEAAESMGASRRQVLTKVQLPQAWPSIMLGVNQMILLVMSMIVIAGLVGGGALGVDVVYGLTKGELGLGVEAGIAIVALAVVLDRITQGWGARGRTGAGSRIQTKRGEQRIRSRSGWIGGRHRRRRCSCSPPVGAAAAASRAVGSTQPLRAASGKWGGSVTIAVNPWDGSAANAEVAKAVLAKQGVTVTLKDIDENAVWAGLDSGSIDANLEVWPSGHASDIDTYIKEKKSVVDGGLLGPTRPHRLVHPGLRRQGAPRVQDVGGPQVGGRGQVLRDRGDR